MGLRKGISGGIAKAINVVGGSGGSAVAPLLIDTHTGAAAAWSLSKIRNAATQCVRVRRSSDSAEQDFGFVDGFLDTASLLTFCGAGNGFVTTWYDQSGNGKNLTQATALSQPSIVTSGSLVTSGGVAALGFTPDQSLNATSVTTVANCDCYLIYSITNTSMVASNGGVNAPWFAVAASGSTSDCFMLMGTPTGRKNGASISPLNRGTLFTATSTRSQITFEAVSFASHTTLAINGYSSGFAALSRMQEFIIFSRGDTELSEIETDINSRWSVY